MNKSILSSVILVAIATLISGCNERAQYDAEHQAGANPPLPSARSFFTPPMQVPKYAGWQNGETPKVADGLKIEKIASGLEHPRQVYALPNGDILVAESNSPDAEPVTSPKQVIAGMQVEVKRSILLQLEQNYAVALHDPFGTEGNLRIFAFRGKIFGDRFGNARVHRGTQNQQLVV